MNDLQAFLFRTSSLLTSSFSRSLIIASFHNLRRPLAKIPPTSNFREFCFFFSSYPDQNNLFFCKRSAMAFNFTLFFSFTVEILSSDVTLHIHLIIFLSFLSALIILSSSGDQVYNLTFAPKSSIHRLTKVINP